MNKLTLEGAIENVAPEEIEFNGMHELTEIPFVKWCMQSQSPTMHGLRFYRLSLKGNELYAEYNMGTRYTYIGKLDHTRDIHLREFGLGSVQSWDR